MSLHDVSNEDVFTAAGEVMGETISFIWIVVSSSSVDSVSHYITGPSLPLKKGSDQEVGVVSSKVV